MPDGTIYVRGSRSTYLQTTLGCVCCLTNSDTATNVHLCIAQDVTILTATEDGTEDAGSATDVDFRLLHVGPGVESCALVSLTGTEEVTGHRVILCIFICTRHAKRTTHHVDSTLTAGHVYQRLSFGIIGICTHIGCLVTAIYTGQNMTTSNIYHRITIHGTSRTKPLVSNDSTLNILDLIRIITRTATEYTTIVGMTVGTFLSIFRITNLCVWIMR